MTSNLELDSMIQNYYTKSTSDAKRELLEELKELWGKSTINEYDEWEDIRGSDIRFKTLNKLYTAHTEDDVESCTDFMIILLMTMRTRVQLEDLHKKERFLRDPGLNGLRSLLNHWNEQQNDGEKLDVVCEFIGSRQKLRKPEYIIGALIEQVRRIRRGWKPGKDTHLEISDGLLHLAEHEVGKITTEGDVGNYNVVPNNQLKLFVEFQKILNKGKRPITARNLNSDLDKFLRELGNADDFFAKDIYEWWAHYSMLRNFRRCMMSDEAKDCEEMLTKVRNNMKEDGKKEFTDELKNKGGMLRGVSEEMQPLVEYHQGLVKFLNGYRKKKEIAAPDGANDNRDWKLYSTIFGGAGKIRRKRRLFVNHKREPVMEKEYREKKSTSNLINRMEHSITNAELASHSVISRSHLLAPVMLVLLATDLAVRFRWFASPAQAAMYDEDGGMKRISIDVNHREADRLKKELIGVLENIQSRLKLVLPDPNPAPPAPLQLMEGWISALKDLELMETKGKTVKLPKEVDSETKLEVELTALGQLSDECGKFVNWPWSHAWQSTFESGKRKVFDKFRTGDENILELYIPQQNGKQEPMVTISFVDDGEYANHFAYVKAVKGSPS